MSGKSSAMDMIMQTLSDPVYSQRVNDATLADNGLKASASPGQALGRFLSAPTDSGPEAVAVIKTSGPKPG